MANISLVRLDSRLIHGQVITKWVKIANANRIIIVDDELAKDEFMVMIYSAAAPKNVEVEILDVENAAEKWGENEFGAGTVMLLFKDVKTCAELEKRGVPIKSLQIGGLPSAPGRKTILRAVSLDKEDMDLIADLNNKGIEIYIHIIPEEPRMDYDKIKKVFED